jgi:serpin B
LATGARGNTLDEVLAVLGAVSCDEVAGIVQAVAENALAGTNDPSGPLVVRFACSVWCQKDLSLKPAYQQVAVEFYKAETHAVDFMRKVSSSSST